MCTADGGGFLSRSAVGSTTLRGMIEAELVRLLCCPETHQDLRLAEAALLDQLNRQIAAGSLKNRGGKAVAEKLDEGLVRADGKWLYPVRQGIPVMLLSEAIPLS
jgi:uncharacterized protein YbaR (Trm112 family)